MSISRWLCAVAVLVAGCKNPEAEKAEADLVAAKARVAALKTRIQKLGSDRTQAEVGRWANAQQADEAQLAAAQLSAADDVLDGKELAPAFALPGMLVSKDAAAVAAFAKKEVQDVLPCAQEGDPDYTPDYSRGEDCEPPPLEDACVGVDERSALTAHWVCGTKIAGEGKLPALLSCTLEGEYPPGAPKELNASGLSTGRTLVRAAFTVEGHLYVADYPAPAIDVYQPRNELERAACSEENEKLSCERKCDERYGRLDRPDCGYGPAGWNEPEGDEPGDDDSDEAPEVRAAKEQAAEAERRAAEAEKEAQEARQEVEYQECHTACRPDPGEAREKHASDVLKYLSSPGAGVLAYARTLEVPADNEAEVAELRAKAAQLPPEEGSKLQKQADEAEGTRDTQHFLVLLKFADYTELAQGKAPVPGDEKEVVHALERVAELKDGALQKVPGKVLAVGLAEGKLKALAFDPKGEMTEVDDAEACKALGADVADDVKAACGGVK